MRAAPSVHLHCADDGAWRWAQVSLVGSSTLSLCYWLLCWWVGPGWPAATAACGTAALATLLAGRFTRTAVSSLQWDGAQWVLRAPDDAEPATGCDVALVFDLGDWLLLRVTPPRVQRGRVVWLPVSRRAAATAWHGLRVALHTPHRSAVIAHAGPRTDLLR